MFHISSHMCHKSVTFLLGTPAIWATLAFLHRKQKYIVSQIMWRYIRHGVDDIYVV